MPTPTPTPTDLTDRPVSPTSASRDWSFPAVSPTPEPTRNIRTPPRRAIWVLASGGLGGWVVSASTLRGAGGTMYALLTVVALLASGVFGEGRRQPLVLTLGAGLFGVFLVIRDSPWLSFLNISALIVFLVMAALLAAEGSLFNGSRSWIGDRISVVFESYFRAFRLAARLLRGRVSSRNDGAKPGRKVSYKGLFLATPLLMCLIPLLMTSDAVFSRVFSLPVSLFASLPTPSTEAIFAIGVCAYLAAVLVAMTVAGDPTRRVGLSVDGTDKSRAFSTRDVATACWAVNVVLGMFAISQIVAATNLATKLVKAPPSYEAIAKRGFFPLLVASVLILTSFAISHALLAADGRSSRSFLVPAQVLVVLSLVVVAVASRRLYMGAQVWGLTMLRVMSQMFVIWLAAMFVLIGVWQQRRSSRSWLPGAALIVAAALLVVLNIAPTERLVVRWNISSGFAPAASDGISDDTSDGPSLSRISGLSSCRYYDDKWHGQNDDARPALLGWIRSEVQQNRATNECARELLGCDQATKSNGLNWNLARSRGASLRSKACREFPSVPLQVAPPS